MGAVQYPRAGGGRIHRRVYARLCHGSGPPGSGLTRWTGGSVSNPSGTPDRLETDLGSEKQSLSGQFPQPQRTVIPTGHRPLAVGRKGHGGNLFQVAAEELDLLAGLDVPEARGTIFTAGQRPLPIRRKGYAPDALGVALEPAHLLAGLHIPQAHKLIPTGGERLFAVG